MKNILSILLILAAMAAYVQQKMEITIDTQSKGIFSIDQLFHKNELQITLISKFEIDTVRIGLTDGNSDDIIIFDSVVTSPPEVDIAGCTKVIHVRKLKNVMAVSIYINGYPKVYVHLMRSRHYLNISKTDFGDEKYLHIDYQKYRPQYM